MKKLPTAVLAIAALGADLGMAGAAQAQAYQSSNIFGRQPSGAGLVTPPPRTSAPAPLPYGFGGPAPVARPRSHGLSPAGHEVDEEGAIPNSANPNSTRAPSYALPRPDTRNPYTTFNPYRRGNR